MDNTGGYMNREFKDALEASPIIAAVKDDEGLQRCKESDSQIVFILYGDICSIADKVEEVKACGKLAMVHIDLITGLSPKEIAVDFIKKYTNADGIIPYIIHSGTHIPVMDCNIPTLGNCLDIEFLDLRKQRIS